MTPRKDTDTEDRLPTVRTQATSEESRKQSEKTKNKKRDLIYTAILRSMNGKTCEEIENELGIMHQSASCIIRTLAKQGWIFNAIMPDGRKETRQSAYNRDILVWRGRHEPINKTEFHQKNLF